MPLCFLILVHFILIQCFQLHDWMDRTSYFIFVTDILNLLHRVNHTVLHIQLQLTALSITRPINTPGGTSWGHARRKYSDAVACGSTVVKFNGRVDVVKSLEASMWKKNQSKIIKSYSINNRYVIVFFYIFMCLERDGRRWWGGMDDTPWQK